MNDEIKEILDKLQKVANRETASRNALMEMKDKDYQLLLDYITNLEKENKVLLEKYLTIQILYNASKLKKELNKDIYIEERYDSED